MLISQLRNASETWAAKGLMFLIGLSFVFWGFGGSMLGGTDNSVRVGGRTISAQEIDVEARRQIAQMSSLMGGAQFNYQQALEIGLIGQIVDNMIVRVLLDLRAADVGLAVSNEKIYEIISTTSQFMDEKKNFSPETFAYVLEANNLTERDFVKSVAEGVLREMLAGAIVGEVSAEAWAEIPYRLKYESRTVDLITINPLSEKVAGAPSDEALREIYAREAERFSEPEYRTLSYALITPEDAARVKKIAKLDPAAAYRAMVETAENIIDEVAGGDTLIAAAKEVGVKSALLPEITVEGVQRNGAKLADSNVSQKMLDIAFFSLDEGGVSDVIEAKNGVLLVSAAKVSAARPKPFETVKPELVSLWKAERQRESAAKKTLELARLIGEGKSASEAVMTVDKSAQFQPNLRVSRTDAKVAPALLSLIFDTDAGAQFSYGHNVGVVKKIALGGAEGKEDFARYKDSAKKSFSLAILDDYTSWLGRKYSVKRPSIYK